MFGAFIDRIPHFTKNDLPCVCRTAPKTVKRREWYFIYKFFIMVRTKVCWMSNPTTTKINEKLGNLEGKYFKIQEIRPVILSRDEIDIMIIYTQDINEDVANEIIEK